MMRCRKEEGDRGMNTMIDGELLKEIECCKIPGA